MIENKLPFYQWIKDSYNQNKSEWKALFVIATLLILVFSTKLIDLARNMLLALFWGISLDLFWFKRVRKE